MRETDFYETSQVVIKLEKHAEGCMEVYTEIPVVIKKEEEISIITEYPYESLKNEAEFQNSQKIAKLVKSKATKSKLKWIPTPNSCEICRVTLSSRQSLNYHNNTFHSNKPKPVFQCHLCPRSFPQPNFLRSHMRTHQEKNIYGCDICGKSNLPRLKLQRHMAMHRKIMSYQCDLCPKVFKTKKNITRHVVTHVERERIKCPDCDEMIFPFNMRYHVFKHTKEKPYKCDLCPASFVAKNKLTYHRRTHTGEKPFKCKLCSKAFTYNQSLKDHHKIFHTNFKLECNYCGKNYMSNAGISYHYKTNHLEEIKKKLACIKIETKKENMIFSIKKEPEEIIKTE